MTARLSDQLLARLKDEVKRRGGACVFIREERVKLQNYISYDPEIFLDYLDSQKIITRNVYRKAKEQGSDKISFVLNNCIDGGEEVCQKVLDVLMMDEVQEHYPRLKEWLAALEIDSSVQNKQTGTRDADSTPNAESTLVPPGSESPPAFHEKLKKYNDQELHKRTTNLRSKLVDALQGHVVTILNELISKDVLTSTEFDRVKNTQRGGGEAAATELLDIIDAKGKRKAKPFWEALWAERETYTKLMDIFEEL